MEILIFFCFKSENYVIFAPYFQAYTGEGNFKFLQLSPAFVPKCGFCHRLRGGGGTLSTYTQVSQTSPSKSIKSCHVLTTNQSILAPKTKVLLRRRLREWKTHGRGCRSLQQQNNNQIMRAITGAAAHLAPINHRRKTRRAKIIHAHPSHDAICMRKIFINRGGGLQAHTAGFDLNCTQKCSAESKTPSLALGCSPRECGCVWSDADR